MNKILRAVLIILKNATIVVPLLEGVVYSIRDLVNPPLTKEIGDDEKNETSHTR